MKIIAMGPCGGALRITRMPTRVGEDVTETDDPTLVGGNCYVFVEKDDGPRGDPAIPVDDYQIED